MIILLKYSSKVFNLFFILFSIFSGATAYADYCRNLNLSEISDGIEFSCVGNRGQIYARHINGSWLAPNGRVWYPPFQGSFNYRSALRHCNLMKRAHIPSVDEVLDFLEDLSDLNTSKRNAVFKVVGNLQEVWTSTRSEASPKVQHCGFYGCQESTSGFYYLWNLKTNQINSSTYSEHWASVVCVGDES